MTSRGRAAVAGWLGLMAACAVWLAHGLHLTTDMSAFLPPAATQAQEILIGQLRSGAASKLLLLAIEDASPSDLAQASSRLAEKLSASGLFESVANGDRARAAKDLEHLFALRYALSPGVTPARFSVEGLRAALQESLALLASPLSAEFRQWLPADPTGEMLRIAGQFAKSAGPDTQHGVWFSKDGKRALLLAGTHAAGFDLDAQEKALSAIRRAFAEVAPANARLRIAGPGLAAVTARATIERDAARSSLIASAGILLVLLFAYRSAWPVLFSALPAASGMLLGVTAVSLWFGPVHGITVAFAAILIGEAVDYPTYLYAQAGRGEALESTLARIGATLRLAVLTTACGALSMLLSSFNGLAQLGLLTIAGVISAGLVTRWVLPALTPAGILERKLVRLPFVPALPAPRLAWPAVGVLAIAAVLVLFQNNRLWDDDLSKLTPLPEEIKKLDRELRSQLGAPDPRYLILATAAERELLLQKSERIAGILDGVVKSGGITGYELAAQLVPSRKLQEARRAALPDAVTLAANLEQAGAGLPFRPGLFAPFLADVERARAQPLLMPETLRGTALGAKVASLLVPIEAGWAALVPLAGVSDARALEAALAASGERDVLLLDLKREADALVAGYRSEALRLLGIGLACIALLVYAGLRSAAATARVLAPVLAATLLTVATLSLAGVQLTLFHLVALLLVIGVGTNYALFFNQPRGGHGDHGERALMLLSLAVASLATFISASALSISGTPVLRAIGLTAAVGTVYALVLSALLAPRAAR